MLDLQTTNITHFDDVVTVKGTRVGLLRCPEPLVFISAKTKSATVAPWLRV